MEYYTKLTNYFSLQRFLIAMVAIATVALGTFFIARELRHDSCHNELSALYTQLQLLKEFRYAMLSPIEQIVELVALNSQPHSPEHDIALATLHDFAIIRTTLRQEIYSSPQINSHNAVDILRIALQERIYWLKSFHAQYHAIADKLTQFNQKDPIVHQLQSIVDHHKAWHQHTLEHVEKELQLLGTL